MAETGDPEAGNEALQPPRPLVATERNWGLWGLVYTTSRNALGMERAKKMITFCFNSRAQGASIEDFGLLLSVVEGTADGE